MNVQEQADAIQQDVSTIEAELPTLTSEDSPRMRALAAIDAKNIAARKEEMGDESSNDLPSDTQLSEQLADPVQPERQGDAPEVKAYKVKVDGVEHEVDAETLVRSYQKNSAADRRLEEAAQILRNAQQVAAQTATSAEPVVERMPEVSADARQQAAALVESLYSGETDAATEALAKILAQNRGGDQPTPQQPVDTDVLTSQVLERIAVNTAFERVQTDYPEIISDPDLEALAVSKIDRLMASGKPRSVAMIEAVDDVYRLIGKTPAGRQAPQKDTTRSVRQENKERLDPVPAASAVAVSQPPPAESSPSSLIAEMAKNRLGQSLPL